MKASSRSFLFVRALFDLNLLRIALRLHFLVLKPWLGRGLGGGGYKNNSKETSGYVGVSGVRGSGMRRASESFSPTSSFDLLVWFGVWVFGVWVL